MDNLNTQSSSPTSAAATSSLTSAAATENTHIKVNIYAELVPQLMPRDQCMSTTTFREWREHVEHVTTAFPLTCESEDEAILNLYIERESILEQVWVENELLGRMGKARVTEQLEEEQLYQELKWMGMQLGECSIALQALQKQFDEFKARYDEPKVDLKWIDESFPDNAVVVTQALAMEANLSESKEKLSIQSSSASSSKNTHGVGKSVLRKKKRKRRKRRRIGQPP
ncbi:hypothetical protein RIF29_42345 [Crotalaria pallida]|uniref:Uncharacterized protein n=1 Tax=Crotalaria pallida TaxID=3830 RepID=A0AAN9ECP7_CROPI